MASLKLIVGMEWALMASKTMVMQGFMVIDNCSDQLLTDLD